MMTALGWGRLYGISVEQIDADHRIISELILQLDDAVETGQSRDVVANIIAAIVEFTHHHLEREQTLWTEAKSLNQASHAQLHTELADLLDGLVLNGMSAKIAVDDLNRIKSIWDALRHDETLQSSVNMANLFVTPLTAGAAHGA